ncbi:MAG TPA: hypothetical protein PL182_13545, partial [Pseudobdellovibrionaceae bacterium]|nr:hypothetical protein [Pseudobdellovibrionaceae bacterium]
GRACAVTVSFQPSYQLYIVTVAQETKAGGVQQMSFAIDPNSRVSPRSYLGRFSEFIETSVEVEMGRIVSFPSTYGTFAERTMGVEIRKDNEVKSPTARKIWVTNQRAGKIGASGPACIIELVK